MEGIELSTETGNIDFAFVNSPARIALYDDMLSSPRIIDVKPAETGEFIGKLSAEIYNQAQQLGGSIPYTIISQVAENFIHASFKEMVVSIFDSGNTIRFTDQGPGIADKLKAQQPGYSSATREMKAYINGVGSGLPIVREYLDTKHGTIHIEDNMNSGAVVTISLVDKESAEGPAEETPSISSATQIHQTPNLQNSIYSQSQQSIYNAQFMQAQQFENPVQPFTDGKIIDEQQIFQQPAQQSTQPYVNPVDSQRSLQLILSSLSKREISIIYLFKNNDVWGITDISKETGIPASSTSNLLSKLEQMGILIKVGKKRALSDLGEHILNFL